MSMNATFVQVDEAELARLQADPSLLETLFEDESLAPPALTPLTKAMQDRVRAAGPGLLADALSRFDPATRLHLEADGGTQSPQHRSSTPRWRAHSSVARQGLARRALRSVR